MKRLGPFNVKLSQFTNATVLLAVLVIAGIAFSVLSMVDEVSHSSGTARERFYWVPLLTLATILATSVVSWTRRRSELRASRQSDQTLGESETKYRTLIKGAPVGIVVSTFDGTIIDVNDTLVRMHGYQSKQEFSQSKVSDRYGDLTDRDRWVGEVWDAGKVHGFEVLAKRKDGSTFWSSTTAIPLRTETGEQQMLSVIQDVTNRKAAEEQIATQLATISNIVDSHVSPIFSIDSAHLYTSFNRAHSQVMKALYGKNIELGHSLFDCMTVPEDRVAAKANIDRALRGERVIEEAYSGEKGSGRRYYEVSHDPIIGREGKVVGVSVFARDMTARRQMEEALRSSEEKYRSLVNNVRLGVFRSSPGTTGRFLEVNPAMETITGYSRDELMSIDVCSLYKNPGERAAVSDEISNTDRTLSRELAVRNKDGTALVGFLTAHAVRDDQGHVLHFDCVLEDITDRKRAEAELMLADRLASIGEMVAGVAHEINNPLTSVLGFSQLVLEKDVNSDVKKDLLVISDEAQRVSRIVRDLLTFARKHDPVMKMNQINDILRHVVKMREYEQTANGIEVVTHLSPNLPEVLCDSFQFQQVFMNIVLNAEYFMIEAHHRGRLTIVSEPIEGWIRVSVADDGPGISSSDVKHIFDPFFTTKEVGKGTGLGLSICHGVVSKHGGRIYATSEKGEGTTLVVELPIALGIDTVPRDQCQLIAG